VYNSADTDCCVLCNKAWILEYESPFNTWHLNEQEEAEAKEEERIKILQTSD
jgi:hypothetical protein